jgi:flagellar biosynthesis/type III secretory pathway M-ring protein FliF/YscJ
MDNNTASEREKLQLERDRFNHESQLERERLEHDRQLDQKKIDEERRRTRLTAGSVFVSIFVPLTVAAVTFASASCNQKEQAEAQLKLQEEQANDQFELKAAEIVMTSDNPKITYNKARAMRALFPGHFPPDFAATFNPDEFSSNEAGVIQSKKELLNLLAEHPEQRKQIIDTWKQLFPEDEWVKELE